MLFLQSKPLIKSDKTDVIYFPTLILYLSYVFYYRKARFCDCCRPKHRRHRRRKNAADISKVKHKKEEKTQPRERVKEEKFRYTEESKNQYVLLQHLLKCCFNSHNNGLSGTKVLVNKTNVI